LRHFSNFGSLKSTETSTTQRRSLFLWTDFSNFGSLKSTETPIRFDSRSKETLFQQFRLVEEH